MEPVIGEVICKECQYPYPPGSSEGKEAETVYKHESAEDHGFSDKAYKHVANAHGKATEGILRFKVLPVLFVQEPDLEEQQHHETWDGKIQDGGGHGAKIV